MVGYGAAAVWFSDTIVVTTSGVQDLREIYGKKIIITRVRYVSSAAVVVVAVAATAVGHVFFQEGVPESGSFQPGESSIPAGPLHFGLLLIVHTRIRAL